MILTVKYLHDNILAVKRAINAGVPVLLYNLWPTLDLLSTDNGY